MRPRPPAIPSSLPTAAPVKVANGAAPVPVTCVLPIVPVGIEDRVGIEVAFNVRKTLAAAAVPIARSRLFSKATLDAMASLDEARLTEANEL